MRGSRFGGAAQAKSMFERDGVFLSFFSFSFSFLHFFSSQCPLRAPTNQMLHSSRLARLLFRSERSLLLEEVGLEFCLQLLDLGEDKVILVHRARRAVVNGKDKPSRDGRDDQVRHARILAKVRIRQRGRWDLRAQRTTKGSRRTRTKKQTRKHRGKGGEGKGRAGKGREGKEGSKDGSEVI